MPDSLLSVAGMSKRFGATQALLDVSLDVQAHQVHALVGENGAGKSTLMKILTGVYHPDAGQMTINGGTYAPSNPAAARRAGVAMIYQELNLAPHLTVEANIMLGQERATGGWIKRGEQARLVRDALARLSRPDIPLDAPVGSLPIGVQQLIEIARALVSDARVLIFDEPTSSLTEEDTAHLFDVIRDLRDDGLGIVYISHFLEEVADVCDIYTVLRDGEAVGHGDLSDVSLDEVIHLMVGRELSDLFPHVPHSIGAPMLEIDRLCGKESPRDVDLTLHRGEIVGLAGLIGAGRSELVRRVFGLEEVVSGQVRVVHGGSAESARVGRGPGSSIRNGLGLVSEDRKEEGLALSMSIADNLTMTRLAPYRRFGILNLRRRSAAADKWMARVKCKAVGPNQVVEELSGGNQQKIAIARLLHQKADVLLLDEPTRGVDVGTKAEVYRLIGELAAGGAGIILVSSYLPELMNVCDRIGVMCRGRLREIRNANDWTEDEIMHCATGREANT